MHHPRFTLLVGAGAALTAMTAIAVAQNLRVVGRVTGDGPASLVGPVGIGTQPGADRLTVNGKVTLAGDDSSPRALRASGPNQESHNLIAMFPTISTRRIFIGGQARTYRCIWNPGQPVSCHVDLVGRKVGVGTTAPTRRLDVAGDIGATGRYYGGLGPAAGRFYATR